LKEFLSRNLFAGADALHQAMAQSHNLELITTDKTLVKAALDGSSRALRELLGRMIYRATYPLLIAV
jgi:predicted nucleic acid-binding protein